MKNENFKKFFAVFSALCIVLSVTFCLFPPLEVNAEQVYNLKDTVLWKYLPTGNELYNLQVYEEGIENSDLSEEILKGCNYSSLLNTEESNAYITRYENFKSMLNDKTLSITGFIGGYSLEEIQFNVDSYPSLQWFRDFLNDDTGYNVYLAINESDTGFQLDYYICADSLENHCFSCNGGGYLYSLSNTTVYLFSINLQANNFYNNPNVQVSTVNISNDKISPTGFPLYTDFPLYFTWKTGFGNTYESLNSSTAIRNFLSNGQTSQFLVDRRTLMSNYGDGYTSENDPMSIDYSGAWDLDLVPVNDLITGQINVKYAPSEKLVEENPNYRVKYWFQFMGSTSPISMNDVVSRPQFLGGFLSIYGINANSVGQYKFDFSNYYTVKSSSYWETLSNEYNSYNASTVLGTMYPKIGSFVYKNGANTEYIEPYDALRFYKYMNWYTQTTGISANASFGSISIGASSSGGQISALKLTVYAQAFSGDTPITNVANTTYNYLDGSITKVGTVSTNNNTPIDSVTGVPDGLTPQEYQEIQDTTNDINTNGNITGGNNTNNNTNNPTFTNNNNPTITINNNNGLTEPDGVPDDPSEGSFSMLWSIWESYHFAEWLNQDLQGNGFLHYIFSSEIWDLPIFNLIIPALAILITVSIASTIIRFIRGN